MRDATGSSSPTEPAAIARGARGAGLIRRAYWRSPLRGWRKVTLAHRGLRPNDLFVASYPRSGSAWLRFMLADMLLGEASFERIARDLPYVGRHQGAPSLLPGGGRVIKTHEAYDRRYRRALHLVRDPRDVVISYFHFQQRRGHVVIANADPAASFDRFIDAFLAGRADAHGTWQTHVLSWHVAAETGSCEVIRLRYEDLHANTEAELVRIAAWIGRELTNQQAAAIAERCSFEAMRSTEARERVSSPQAFERQALRSGLPAVRQGRVAAWRAELTTEQQARFGVFAQGLALMGYPPAGPASPPSSVTPPQPG